MKLLIIGASVRAAAQSAHRAGYEIVASDLFADRDLREIATSLPVSDYPGEFRSVRDRYGDLPLIYTGGLENHPRLIERLATVGPVFGNDGETLRQVRDPLALAKALESDGLPFPNTTLEPPSPADDHDWLLKPRQSAGGIHVKRWSPNSPRPAIDHVFQQQIPGPPCSGCFVVAKTNRRVRFLGTTQMLIGRDWLGPNDFSYCGSTSTQPSTSNNHQWLRIGQSLCDQFRLTGVFGVDAIETMNGIVPIEVNPRYTASMEVVEPSLPMPILAYHVAACRDEPIADDIHGNYRPAAKLIVYATESFVVPEVLPPTMNDRIRLADLPNSGQRIEPGQPILTILAHTATDSAENLLRRVADDVRTRIQTQG